MVLFDFAGAVVDACFYNQLVAPGLKHSGDAKTGEESQGGFDEVITIDVDALPPTASMMAFVVNCFHGGDFSCVETAGAQVGALLDASGKNVQPIASISIGCGGQSTACILAVMHKRGGSWMLRAVGTMADGRNFQESMPAIRKVIDTLIDPGLRGERVLSMDKVLDG